MAKKIKRAEMSFLGAILAFAIIVLMTPVFEYSQTSERIAVAEENILNQMKDVCTADTILVFDKVKYKDGTKADLKDEEKYISAIFTNLGYKQDGANRWKKSDTVVSDTELHFDCSDYTFSLSYKLNMPFKVLNKEISSLNINKAKQVKFTYKGV